MVYAGIGLVFECVFITEDTL